MAGYNYERFDEYVEAGLEIEEFSAFSSMLHASERGPGGKLLALEDGGRVRLSDLWAERGVVLEFGSFT